jgi:hypothetical protein
MRHSLDFFLSELDLRQARSGTNLAAGRKLGNTGIRAVWRIARRRGESAEKTSPCPLRAISAPPRLRV